jgi:hypothetical protein
MERRAAQRQRVLKGGSIEFDGAGVDCVVRNISATGAGVEIVNPVGIPHEITLSIPTRDVREHSYIVWRKEKRFGIKFSPLS